jgi:hypothetical protein
MPDPLFNPENGFKGPDVPAVDAPEPQYLRRPDMSRRRSSTLPWMFTFVDYILLAAIDVAAVLVAFLAMKAF